MLFMPLKRTISLPKADTGCNLLTFTWQSHTSLRGATPQWNKYPYPCAHTAHGDVVPHWDTIGSLTGWKKSTAHPPPLHWLHFPSPPPPRGISFSYYLNHSCKVIHWEGRSAFFWHSQKFQAIRLRFDTISPPTNLGERILSSPSSQAKQLFLGCTINAIREVNPEF